MICTFTIPVLLSFPTSDAALCARGLADPAAAAAAQATTERVSLRSTGAQADEPSAAPSISDDGRWVAFHSDDPSMVPGDTNGVTDVFLRDMLQGTTTRVSVATGGGQADGASSSADISDDGRYTAFHSAATNLIPNDTNDLIDVFLHDRVLGTTIRVSVNYLGAELTGGHSVGGVVSASGGFVAFRSRATNIMNPGNPDSNGVSDIYRWSRHTGSVRRVSLSYNHRNPTEECIGPAISESGRFVAFYTKSGNLLHPFIDLNRVYDVYVRDLNTSRMEIVSRQGRRGSIGNADSTECSISANGRYVAFRSAASNLITGDGNGVADIYLRDRHANITERISVHTSGAEANGGSAAPRITDDGRFVVFESNASNLIAGDTNGMKDIFMRDTLLDVTIRVSVAAQGDQADGHSVEPAVSSDGRFFAFASMATNLVPGDTNLAADVFRRDRGNQDLPLTMSGACPGAMTLTINNATPNENVALVYGPAGSFTVGAPPCAGLMLDVSSPTLGVLRRADAVGAVGLSFTVGGGACGVTVQAVDVQTCRKSGVVML